MRLNSLALALSPVLFGTLAFAAFRSTVSPAAPIPVSASDPVLEIHDDSLTTYKPAGASAVQDVRPIHLQRGVNIEGSVREAPSFPMALNGNPFEGFWATSARQGEVRLDTGAYAPMDVDIALPSEGIPWVVARTYNSRQETSGGAHRDSNGPQGYNWFQNSQPEIVLHKVNGSAGADDDGDLLYLLYRADAYVEFKRVDIVSGTSDTFKATNGAAGAVLYAAGAGSEPDTYTYTDQHGVEFTFFGFDGDSSPAEGQLWTIEDNASNVTFVGHATTGSTAITSGYDAGGRIETAYDASDRRFSYTYTDVNGTDRLTQVKAEIKSGANWTSPGTVTMVAQVDYDYYTTAEARSWGESGDLELVTVTEPLTDAGVELVKKKHYRYWEGTYNAGSNQGHDHAVQYVLDFEGARRFDLAGDSSLDGDYLTAASATMDTYAHAYFEYDSDHRVDEAKFNGACGCGSSGSNGSHTFTYEPNGSFSGTSGYDNVLYYCRTVVAQPSYGGEDSDEHSPYVITYFDETGQVDAEVKTDGGPGVGSPDFWASRVKRSGSGLISATFTPESITSYTHSSGAVATNSSAGLVHNFERVSSGAAKGFVERQSHINGESGTAYWDRGWSYGSGAITVGDAEVARPYQSGIDVYTEEINSGTSGLVTTTVAMTFHSGSLAFEKRTVTNPVVSTSKNGSGSATSRSEHYRTDGRMDFAKAEDGLISYSAFEGGQAVLSLRDADTAKNGVGEAFNGVTIPSGFASSGSPLHWKTSFAYDDQGRRTTTTENGGHMSLNYYSRLGDHRAVSMSYPLYETSPSTKFYGPVNYSVSNQAGKQEASARVAISGGSTTSALTAHVTETSSDPVAAAALGDVCRLSLSKYDDPGTTRTEALSYYDVPVSGEGDDGTNYDKTTYTYDNRGQMIRTKDPTGTITRTKLDGAGRQLSTHIGTNDSGEERGDSSGTSTMTKTSESEFDGGASNKNGKLTASKTFKESGGLGEVEASMTYDYRGRLILEVAPDQPKKLHAYDNLGRRTATALYASSSSVDETWDPAATSGSYTGRLALTKNYYDEMGRLWKSTRHKIDQDDGSDDDNLEILNWFDAAGRPVKVDGPELAKTGYDRLGRRTHRFVLARDNDTAYADADDVTGDIVLEESQTTYDPDEGLILMTARTDRHHDDRGAGETTGALDTNADGDELKYTAANVEGRIQITAFWYDEQHRKVDQVRYGTYGGSDFDRDALSVPARSDTALRTSYSYNDNGQLETVEDPRAIVAKYEYDAEGRKITQIRNYDASVNSGAPSGTDDNQTVRWGYTDGAMTSITADVPSGGTDQVTTYIYGVSTTDSPGPSELSSIRLLREVQYPDKASAGDVVRYAYDSQGRRIWMKDQAGNVIETDYDDGGRQTHKQVTALASGFGGDVRRISWEYDDLGRTSTVTQYDNASTSSGTVLDQTAYTYENWGNIETFAIDRDSVVDAVGSDDEYEVSYTYEKATGGRNTVRRVTMTTPHGKNLTYDYLSTDDRFDDDCSRVSRVKRSALELAAYEYSGLGMLVGTEYQQPEVFYRRYDGSGYSMLDRFNRVTVDRWTKDLATDVDFYSVDISYDRNSNITLAEDQIHDNGPDNHYTMDELNRITLAEVGDWSGSAITNDARQQDWTLDHLGNWEHVKLDLDGDLNWNEAGEYDDDRAHNAVNELAARDTDNNGTDDFTLTYDAVGNLIDDGESYEYLYDPFGRLREIKDQIGTITAQYRHNGLGFRIAELVDTDDDGDADGNDVWFYTAYDERWRELCFYREEDSSPKTEWLYQASGADGLADSSYVDGLLQRRRDSSTDWSGESGDGTFEEKLYACQNWRSDVVVMLDFRDTIVQHVRYSSYGVPVGYPGGDDDWDGDVDSQDLARIQNRVDGLFGWGYSVLADVDLDGDVDAADKSIVVNDYQGVDLGWGILSSLSVRLHRGYAGRVLQADDAWLARRRVLKPSLGCWTQRDPLGYVDGMSLSSALRSNPVRNLDPAGERIIISDPDPLVENWLACIFSCLYACSQDFRDLADYLDDSKHTHRYGSAPPEDTEPHGGAYTVCGEEDPVGAGPNAAEPQGDSVASGDSEMFITPSDDRPSGKMSHEAMHAKDCDEGARRDYNAVWMRSRVRHGAHSRASRLIEQQCPCHLECPAPTSQK